MTEQRRLAAAARGAEGISRVIPSASTAKSPPRMKAAAASLLLDGKPVRTPGKAPFVVPNKAFAEAIGEEWRGQGPRIDPATMPLTRLANSVIDGVKGHEEAVIDDILNYAGSDLICYRAEGPKGLVTLQTKHWDPIVAWAKRDLGVPMRLAEGVMHVAQPPSSLDAIGKRLAGFDSVEPCRLARHDRALRLGAACLGDQRSGASRRKRPGKRRMSMRIGRSANGARMRRRKSGARTAGATSPPRRAWSSCCGPDRLSPAPAASAIIAERGDDLGPGPGRNVRLSTKRQAERPLSCMPSWCQTAGETSKPAFASKVLRGVLAPPNTKSKSSSPHGPTSCHWAKHERSFRLISTQRFFSRGSRPERSRPARRGKLTVRERSSPARRARRRGVRHVCRDRCIEFGVEGSRCLCDGMVTGGT